MVAGGWCRGLQAVKAFASYRLVHMGHPMIGGGSTYSKLTTASHTKR